jgi:hypothetical protein
MDACIVTSGTGNAFPKDTGNSQAKEEGIGLGEVLGRVTVQVFVREHCTMIAASVQCDSDGIPKESHDVLLKRVTACRVADGWNVRPSWSGMAFERFSIITSPRSSRSARTACWAATARQPRDAGLLDPHPRHHVAVSSGVRAVCTPDSPRRNALQALVLPAAE